MRKSRRVRCAAQGCAGLKPTRPRPRPRFLNPPVVRMRAVLGIISVLGEPKNIFQSHPFKSKTKENLYQIPEMKLYVFES